MLNSPFLQAGATRSLTSALTKGSKFSFNGILTNLEKTVSTINQVIPLYNQVKPLITNSKSIINSFKGTINNRPKRSLQENPNIINVVPNNQNEKPTIQKPNFDNIFFN